MSRVSEGIKIAEGDEMITRGVIAGGMIVGEQEAVPRTAFGVVRLQMIE